MQCVKGSDPAMNGSDDLERARSRDIVAKHAAERRPADHHFVQRATKGPGVGLRIHR
jgi:hypothetical protein